jgi:hypothetical protein
VTCVEFANPRGDLLVALSSQLVLVQCQDYLPKEYLKQLIENEYVDDEKEDSSLFDFASSFWKRNKNNNKIKEQYPQLWDAL